MFSFNIQQYWQEKKAKLIGQFFFDEKKIDHRENSHEEIYELKNVFSLIFWIQKKRTSLYVSPMKMFVNIRLACVHVQGASYTFNAYAAPIHMQYIPNYV